LDYLFYDNAFFAFGSDKDYPIDELQNEPNIS